MVGTVRINEAERRPTRVSIFSMSIVRQMDKKTGIATFSSLFICLSEPRQAEYEWLLVFCSSFFTNPIINNKNLNKPIIKSMLFAKTIDNVQTLMQSEDETFTSTERLSYDF